MSNYYPTGVRSPIMQIRGMSGLGDVDWSTCARTAPSIDNPAVTECIDANGNVLATKPTAQVAAAGSTIFGYSSTLVIGIGAGLALLLLLKGKKKGGR